MSRDLVDDLDLLRGANREGLGLNLSKVSLESEVSSNCLSAILWLKPKVLLLFLLNLFYSI